MIDATLAQYRVTAKLGEGGMGEVWRAEDTKLGREVALKVLPAAVADDVERLARFEREARVLASLNHPNIATLYGLETVVPASPSASAPGTSGTGTETDTGTGPVTFLVMELVEGEGLDERVARGPIPVEEAVPIAIQIAEALEAAHEQGIVHRDLKPANVRLRPDGTAKVLDFGLAKAWNTEQSEASLSLSPTLTQHATAAGVILGTAAYMAPEQAAGIAADRRADVWAFGVVLWEMLTGQRLFEGETVSHMLASVLKDEPTWESLPDDLPPRVRELLERCLRKKPRRRLQAIGDARIQLEEELADPGGGATSPVDVEEVTPPAPRRAGWVPWTVAAMCALAAVALGVWIVQHPSPDAPVVRFTIDPPPGNSFDLEPFRPGPVVVSPDGAKLVFAAVDTDGTDRLWIRSIDEVEARPLTGTQNAQYPFWAPDSRHIGFFDGASLKRVDSSGGLPLTLCEAPNGKGGSWGPDGTIVFAPDSDSPIHAVAQAGGESEPVTTFDADRGDDSHRHPWFLPDGRRFLYLARFPEGAESGQAIMVGSLDGEPPVEVGRSPAAAAYASGYLLYLRESTLMARPFDPSSLEFDGEPVPVVEEVALLSTGTARAVFSPSENGTLLSQAGLVRTGAALRWRDRSGNVLREIGEPALFYSVELSPDGDLAVLAIGDPESRQGDLWILERDRGLLTRFTSDEGDEFFPIWSADGREIIYSSQQDGRVRVVRKGVESAGAGDVVLEIDGEPAVTDWSDDGRTLLVTLRRPETSWDQLVVSLDDEPEVRELIVTEFGEGGGRLSPDERWIAYQSESSGRIEVYVRPFPGPGRTLRASTAGGMWPRWSADGTEIIYQDLEGRIMAVPVRASGGGVILEPASELMSGPVPEDAWRWDVDADASEFLIIEPVTQQQPEPITVLMNWPAVLDR